MAIRRKLIRETVRDLLTDCEVEGPPVPVLDLARSRGARIVQVAGDDDEIDGFLYRENDQTVIGVNRKHALVRRRFTVAHELGHLLLHETGNVHVDRGFRIYLRDTSSKVGVIPHEMEANRFAAELLMPIEFLRDDLEKVVFDFVDDKELRTLAKRYAVSIQALTIRLTGLGYIPEVAA